MKIRNIVKNTLLEYFDTPLHQQLAAKAEQEKIDYKKDLERYEKDHHEHMTTIHEKNELLGRVNQGLLLSKRHASNFEKDLKKLLEFYNL